MYLTDCITRAAKDLGHYRFRTTEGRTSLNYCLSTYAEAVRFEDGDEADEMMLRDIAVNMIAHDIAYAGDSHISDIVVSQHDLRYIHSQIASGETCAAMENIELLLKGREPKTD